MKIKSLLIVAMCAISFGAYAQTVMFHETFGTNDYHPANDASANGELKANSNSDFSAYKPASGNFYFNEPIFIHGNWAAPASWWPGASQGSVLQLEATGTTKFTIQVKTTSKPYATLSYAHSIRSWAAAGETKSTIKVSYSTDLTNWTEFKKEDAIVGAYGDYDFVEHIENIGGRDVSYVRFEFASGPDSPMIDDIKITGYDDVPIFKSKLEAAIAAAESFVSSASSDPAYCSETVAGLSSTAIAAAKAIANDTNATQAQVDAAIPVLNAAVDAVKATVLNFTAANGAINDTDAFMSSYLYANGAANLKDAFDDAQVVLQVIIITGKIGGACATQAQVDAAITALFAAQAALEAQALDFTNADAAILSADAFKLTNEYAAFSTDKTAAFDAALAALKTVVAANGVVDGAIISEAALAVYVTALENAQQTLVSVDSAAIEGISIASGKILLPAAADIQIYSASGALVLSTYAAQVDITGLPAGVYLLKSNGASVSFAK